MVVPALPAYSEDQYNTGILDWDTYHATEVYKDSHNRGGQQYKVSRNIRSNFRLTQDKECSKLKSRPIYQTPVGVKMCDYYKPIHKDSFHF